jgi:hypothetical protein
MGFVRAYRSGDESDLVPRLRRADLQEIQAGSGQDPLSVLAAGAAQSALACTVIGNYGYVAAMFGIVDEGEFGRVWLVGSDELVTKPLVRQFLRECPKFLDVMCRPYKTVGNVILASNYVHIRWLAYMGFTFHRRLENYGLRGEAFIEFRKDVQALP